MPIAEEALAQARVIWSYLYMGLKPEPGDLILALGTNDLRVAEYAAGLYHRGFGRLLICTGGIAHQGDLLATSWSEPEAEVYARTAIARGVPPAAVLIEPCAVNTAENIRFSRRLIESHNLKPSAIVIAVKPFMQRRVVATFALGWPEMRATLGSPEMTLDEYFTAELTPERILNIMMGDLQRVWVYARKGWSAPQPLPEPVREAYERLKSLGYTRHLLQGEP